MIVGSRMVFGISLLFILSLFTPLPLVPPLNASAESGASGSELMTTALRPDQRIRKNVAEIVAHPYGPDVPKLVADILDDAYNIMQSSTEYTEKWLDVSLEIVSELLRLNPVRPTWHVTAVRASAGMFHGSNSSEWRVYVKYLAQITDSVGARDYYEIHDFAVGVDPRILAIVGLDPPIISQGNLPFLRATNDRISEEPILAQLLLEIARTYKENGSFQEAAIYYDLYLKHYFPWGQSFTIMFEEHPYRTSPIE